MIEGNPHRVPLPPQPQLPREGMLSLIQQQAAQAMFGTKSSDAKPVTPIMPELLASLTIPTEIGIGVPFNSLSELGLPLEDREILSTTVTKFRSLMPSLNVTDVVITEHGLIVRGNSVLDLTDQEASEHAPTVT